MHNSAGPLKQKSKGIGCPYCGQLGHFEFSFSVRRYFRCSSCDLIYHVRTSQDGQGSPLSYYENEYFHDYGGDEFARDGMHLNDHILDIIENHCDTGRLLDVGCGCGFFLKTAQDRGWSVVGVDPSRQSIEKARELLGDAASEGTIHAINNKDSFDVVTIINVLEMTRDPWAILSHAKDLLRPGGCIYLRISNGLFHSSLIRIQAAITKKSILNRLLVFHEYEFTPAFIRKLLREQDFEKINLANAAISGAALYRHAPLLRFLSGPLNGVLLIIATFLEFISGNRWFLGPSLEVTAVKKK